MRPVTLQPQSASRQWAEQALDQALSLNEGERLLYQMANQQQLAAYRIQLNRELGRLFNKIGADALRITVSSQGEYLILSKVATAPTQGVIIKKDGSTTLAPPIEVKPLVDFHLPDIEEEEMLRRREELMKSAQEELEKCDFESYEGGKENAEETA